MEWEKKYEIGNEVVDRQHKELFMLLNDLETAFSEGHGQEKLAMCLKFLVNYAKHHFTAEEELMNRIDYPFLDNQQELHNDMISKLTLVLLRLKKGENIDIGELLVFLQDWVKDHVIEEDGKIGEFLKENSGSGETNKEVNDVVKELEVLRSQYLEDKISEEEMNLQKSKVVWSVIKDVSLANLNSVLKILLNLSEMRLISEDEKLQIAIRFAKSFDKAQAFNELVEIDTKMSYLELLFAGKAIPKEEFKRLRECTLSAL